MINNSNIDYRFWRRRLFHAHGLLGRFSIMVFAVMGFMMMLSVMGLIYLYDITKFWQDSLSEAITIEIPVQNNQSQERQQSIINNVVQNLQNLPSIGNINVLDKSHISDLLSFWFHENYDVNYLELPQLITIHKDKDSILDIDKIHTQLSQIAPDAVINDNSIWLERVLELSLLLKIFAIFFMISILLTCLVMVIFMVKSLFAANHHTINVLTIMGAKERFIINNLTLTVLKESFLGLLIAMICMLIMIIYLFYSVGISDFNNIRTSLHSNIYLWTLLTAPILLIIVYVVARKALLNILQSMHI